MKTSSSFLFWKIFYFFFTCFFTFFCGLDSWEYLYQGQTLFFQEKFSQMRFTVFQPEAYASITVFACYTSLYYLLPFCLTMILFSVSSSLFFEENFLFFLWIVFVCLSIKVSLTLANFYLPFYFEDLFYYQSHDPQLDFEFKWFLDPFSFLKTKGFFICLFLSFIYFPFFFFIYCFNFPSFWFYFLKQKTWISVFLFSFNFLFFEIHWFFAICFIFFFFIYCELFSFFFCLVSSYRRIVFKKRAKPI